MKTIIFIRHGESEGNASPIYLDPIASPLSATGRDQVARAAKRLTESAPYEVLISSPFARAKETANILGQALSVSPIFSDLFIERRKSSGYIGKEKIGPEMRRESELVRDNFREGWRLSDEENFDDLKARAGQALAYLAALPEQNILVSTHGVFMRCMAAYAMFGSSVTGPETQQVMRALRTDNASITTLEYDMTRANPWHIRHWNDCVHLMGATLTADEDRF